jgi:kynureninase
MPALSAKSARLNAWLEFVLKEAALRNRLLDYRIITPPPPHRGAQISLLTGENGKALFDHLNRQGIVTDWREPNVIRLAPVPMYNSFIDVYRLGEALVNLSS